MLTVQYGFETPKFWRVQLVQRVAIYCRVSTTDQSCERQERDLLEYAVLAGYQVIGVWKETASGTKNNRNQRSIVMALAQSHSIDAILVTEMTRWGRSTIDLIETLQELQGWGVSLIAQTGLQFDLNTPQGRLIALAMLALVENLVTVLVFVALSDQLLLLLMPQSQFLLFGMIR